MLNRSSLTKADRMTYTKQMKELSSLNEQISIGRYELERVQSKREQLEIEIEQRKNLLAELEERMRKSKE